MNLLFIGNTAPHYRSAIFRLLDRELGANFVFGDKVQDIKSMDISMLAHTVSIVRNVFFKHCYYQRGVLKYIFMDYDTYLITGEFRCLSTWLMLIILRLYPHKKTYIWTHGWLGKESKIKRLFTSLFFFLPNGIFIYNNRSRKLLIGGGIPPYKLFTIYNSLDYDKQLAIRKELKPSNMYIRYFGNDDKVLIFIGRLTAVKRLKWLLTALDLLKHRGERYNLVLVGDGVERPALEKFSFEKGFSNTIWFCGASYDEYKNAEYLFNADLCVSPGNVGLTAIHSMMYGCPVITNDDFNHQMPEFETITKGVTGDFFTQGNVVSLADTISSWFKAPSYDRNRIRQNCYKVIDSDWNPNRQIQILKDILIE